MSVNTRDWPAILADAEARGLSLQQLADEAGVNSGAVCYHERKHGVRLPRQRAIKRLAESWTQELLSACVAGETANAFCLRMGVSFGALQSAERRHGIKLARQPALPRRVA